MPEVGKRYYFITHAYYHFLGEVMEVLSGKRVKIKDARQIISCERGWTAFFADGCKNDTRFEVWPDGTELEYTLPLAPWNHDIPEAKNDTRRRSR